MQLWRLWRTPSLSRLNALSTSGYSLNDKCTCGNAAKPHKFVELQGKPSGPSFPDAISSVQGWHSSCRAPSPPPWGRWVKGVVKVEQQVVLCHQKSLGASKKQLFLAQQVSFLEQQVDNSCLCDASLFRVAPGAEEKLTFLSSARAMTELNVAGTGGEQHKP